MLTWEAPEFNGGAPITAYEYRYMPEDGSWTGWQDVGLVFTEEVSDLTPAVRYMFEVAARNSRGRGAAAELSEAVLAPNIAPTAAPSEFTAEFDSTSDPHARSHLGGGG